MSVADVVVLLRLCDQLLVMSSRRRGRKATTADLVGHRRSSPKELLVHASCTSRSLEYRRECASNWPFHVEVKINKGKRRSKCRVVGGIQGRSSGWRAQPYSNQWQEVKLVHHVLSVLTALRWGRTTSTEPSFEEANFQSNRLARSDIQRDSLERLSYALGAPRHRTLRWESKSEDMPAARDTIKPPSRHA